MKEILWSELELCVFGILLLLVVLETVSSKSRTVVFLPRAWSGLCIKIENVTNSI